MERSAKVDAMKGILIILVVVAHFQRDTIHDLIFMFHMPLFFIISGFVMKEDKMKDFTYVKKKILMLMITYSCYLFIDFMLQGSYSVRNIVRFIWGGRAISGVYWYVTCFLAVIVMFSFIRKYFSDKTVMCLIFVGGDYSSN